MVNTPRSPATTSVAVTSVPTLPGRPVRGMSMPCSCGWLRTWSGVAPCGTWIFAPGEDEKTVSVPIVDDEVEDDGETFTLVLSNASGAGFANNDQEAVGTIRDANPDGNPDPDPEPEPEPEPVPALPLLGQLLLALALAAGGARSARRRGVSPPRAV